MRLRRRFVRSALVVGIALTAVPTSGGIASSAAAQPATPGGTASTDAAASCWEIKQNDPAAADGLYWLQTPELVAPEQFYCDMTTDGGGWVLIGRGRQDWRPEYQGQGTPAQVRESITGPAAFPVRTLPSTTVDGLLGGGRVDALDDGIRLRRATNTEGTAWQEVRFQLADRDRWVWSFGAEHPVASYSFDGVAGGPGQQSYNFGNDNAFQRVDMRDNHDGQGWVRGWSFGASVTGTNSPNSYLWSSQNGAGFARPFTQVFIRPKVTTADLSYPAIPDSGTPEETQRALLQSGVEPQSWGITGRATNNTGEHYTESQAATQIGDTVFVGGNFRYVQKGANPGPGEQVEQPYLAGFNVHTGEWVSSFRPQLNGQVKTLEALPNGKLIAGGEFTTAGGVASPGVVALDPVTGSVDTTWNLKMENRLQCCPVRVWDLQVHGDWLYLGGSFTHLTGGGQTWAAYARNAARVSVANGTPDHDWNPEFNGTAYDLDVGAGGARFYAAGHMTWSGGAETDSIAVVDTAPGAELVPGLAPPHFSSAEHYQQAIKEVGDRVWVGGSEHSLFSYATSDFTLLSTNITKAGGDFQAIAAVDGVVYATCHCRHWNYSGADQWPNVGTGWTQADKIDFVGAWDAATGEFLPEFNAWINAHRDQGPWDVFRDSTGTVWVLGDFREARQNDGRFTWLGGFARFSPRDTAAPGVPTNLAVTDLGNNTVRLTWTGVVDDRSSVRYEVLRDDRVITITDQTSVVVPTAGAGRYFVRAVDAATNRSASTPVQAAGGGA